MFDQLVIEKLDFYVYCLIDPSNDEAFYIGKGIGNRIFDHEKCAIKSKSSNLKLDRIREIKSRGDNVKMLILRHGIDEQTAFEIEASVIDFGLQCNLNFSNIVMGHDSSDRGLMTIDELNRLYAAKPLTEISDPVLSININRGYKRGMSSDEIYLATKQAWIVGERTRKTKKYALSEYNGVIIEVFEIHGWYKVKTKNNRVNNRWGFDGKVAPQEIRMKYLNRSIAHIKKKGSQGSIRVNFGDMSV